MTALNHAVDLAMRRFVTAIMRKGRTYPATETALVLVATQTDLLTGDLAPLVQLAQSARELGITVIHAPMVRPPADKPNLTPAHRALHEADQLRAGTPGAQFHPDLTPSANDVVLEPFTGLSAFSNIQLADTLSTRRLHRVIIAGARTDIEIDSTARDATESGLHTTVIADCCNGTSPDGHRMTVLTTLPRLVHAVLTLDELQLAWR